jgi:hypothetical protein
VSALRERGDKERVEGLRALLPVASGWYYLGMDDDAGPVLEEARQLLYQGDLGPREQTNLACAYAGTLGQAPSEVALPGIDELFQKLARIWDTFTTNAYYSLSQLELVEAVTLSLLEGAGQG